MKLIGVMPVRNEEWCVGLTARAALQWCDGLVILLHACDDRSELIASEIREEVGAARVSISVADGDSWNEMQHRQYMLEKARVMGATHIAIVDADELLTANLLPTIRSHVEDLGPGCILQLPGYNLRGAIDRYHSTGIWGNRWFSVAFKDDGAANWQGDQFHHREPFGFQNMPYRPKVHGQGGVLHLWGVSERRLIAKHSLYKVTERLRWPIKPVSEIERSYNLAVHESASFSNWGPWSFANAPAEWLAPYADLMRHVDYNDAEPWQAAETKRLVGQHGHGYFQGLDLFGVA